jgi:hypothetical protein
MQHNVHRLLAKLFNMHSQSVPPAIVTEAFLICDELFNRALVDVSQQVEAGGDESHSPDALHVVRLAYLYASMLRSMRDPYWHRHPAGQLVQMIDATCRTLNTTYGLENPRRVCALTCMAIVDAHGDGIRALLHGQHTQRLLLTALASGNHEHAFVQRVLALCVKTPPAMPKLPSVGGGKHRTRPVPVVDTPLKLNAVGVARARWRYAVHVFTAFIAQTHLIPYVFTDADDKDYNDKYVTHMRQLVHIVDAQDDSELITLLTSAIQCNKTYVCTANTHMSVPCFSIHLRGIEESILMLFKNGHDMAITTQLLTEYYRQSGDNKFGKKFMCVRVRIAAAHRIKCVSGSNCSNNSTCLRQRQAVVS